jgi:transcriptional regulator with XRE-family HTH domain
MAGYELIEAVKEATEFKSDYAIAKEIGIGRSNISNYKNTETMPDAITVLKLAELAKLTPSQALAKIQGGYSSVSLVIMTGMASLALLASHPVISTVYYVK